MPSDPGAFTYENWHAHDRGERRGDTFEHPLYSDAEFVAELVGVSGPYDVLNAVARPHPRPHAPVAVLRIEWCGEPSTDPMERTDTRRHHGGFPQDEIAALLSLELGVRFKSAGASRWFKRGGDVRGRPWSFRHVRQDDPVLERPAHGYVVPSLVMDERDFRAVELFLRLPELTPAQSIAVVRAARLYQDAVWIADREPELSWLLLVSAVEVAAGFWRAASEFPESRLRISRPEIIELLEAHGAAHLVAPLAQLLVPYIGATRKFVDFLLEHCPPPPPDRPQNVGERIQWDTTRLERRFKQIYNYRSKALHAGTPFPGPLCLPPHNRPPECEERPLGLAAGFMGSVWTADDLPMLLHTFEYTARAALLRWWRQMLPTSAAIGEHGADGLGA